MAILLTSATTGRPKAVVQTHRAMMQMSLGWLAAVGAEPDTVLLNLNPLSHGSIQVTVNYLAAGATVVLLRSFTPQGALAEIERSRVTHVWLVPQMLRFLLRTRALGGTDTSSLREVLHGAAPISAALLREAGERLPCRFRNVYGMTEMGGPFATVSTGELAPDADSWPGGRGIPGLLVQVQDAAGAELPVREIGEVCVRGPGMMREYWERPGGHRGGGPARLAAHRRPRLDGRARLRLPRRPGQGHAHPRRAERVPGRDRAPPAAAARGRRRGRHRGAGRGLGREPGRVRGAPRRHPGRPGHRGRADPGPARPAGKLQGSRPSCTSSRRSRRNGAGKALKRVLRTRARPPPRPRTD